VTTQPDPRLVEAAKHDPTLDYMIKKGHPPHQGALDQVELARRPARTVVHRA
jgi:hypothetical protein